MEYKLEPNIIESVGELATALYNRKKEPSSLDTSVKALWKIGAKSCQVREKYGRSGSFTSYKVAQQLRAYPKSPAALNVIHVHAKCSIAR